MGRTEPDYICHALLSREDVESRVIDEFVNLYFDGSDIEFLRFFLENTDLTPEELENKYPPVEPDRKESGAG